MASIRDFNATEDCSAVDHAREHVIKLTQNLLDFQQIGMGCDIALQCKDGSVTAHSGMINVDRKIWVSINWGCWGPITGSYYSLGHLHLLCPF